MSQDRVQQDMARILKEIINSYKLNERESAELEIAISNYDYEANDGTVFTRVETIEDLFTEEDGKERIYPTIKQLKAMAEFIKETEKYYILYGYDEFTKNVIDLILSKDENEITKIELLQEFKNTINTNIKNYSENYSLGKSKNGFESEWKRENKKLILIEQMIREEKQKNKKYER